MDQFSTDPALLPPLADATVLLEQEVNRRLQLAVDRANRPVLKPPQLRSGSDLHYPSCEQERLYDALAWQLARPVIGQLETFAEQNPHIERRSIPFRDSVYRDFLWQQSPSLVLSERVAAVIRVHGVEIGTDKLGHFFTEGYSYFEVTDRLQDSVEEGVLFGEWSESLYFGAQTTGVFSYADLAANLNGLRFWNRILAQHPDPLTGLGVTPYVRCDHQRWQLTEAFSFQGYVDSAWNESVNCSAFRSLKLLQQVLNYQPVCRPQALPQNTYGPWQQRVLNPSGLRVLPDSLQPEVILVQRAFMQEVRLPKGVLERIRELRQQLELWRQQSSLTEAGHAEAIQE
ncbi:MAG: hypothetical protein LRY66_03805 [Saccharospirillaceae bacterium]|nr:hypothetical protein [Saccharospirillaceae bacterium]MCD8530484.1 hypothetical protein [Saccharospirillaceae bacterium]